MINKGGSFVVEFCLLLHGSKTGYTRSFLKLIYQSLDSLFSILDLTFVSKQYKATQHQHQRLHFISGEKLCIRFKIQIHS